PAPPALPAPPSCAAPTAHPCSIDAAREGKLPGPSARPPPLGASPVTAPSGMEPLETRGAPPKLGNSPSERNEPCAPNALARWTTGRPPREAHARAFVMDGQSSPTGPEPVDPTAPARAAPHRRAARPHWAARWTTNDRERLAVSPAPPTGAA